MRIVLDLQGAQSASRFRGIGRYTLSLARAIAVEALSRRPEHEIVLALNARLPGIDTIRMAFSDLVPPNRFAIFDVPGPVAEHDRSNIWRARAAELLREHFLTALKPDIVHVASLFEGFVDDAVVSIGALNSQVPNVMTLYDLIPLLRPDTHLVQPGLRAYYLRKLQSLKRAEMLLAISTSSATEAIEMLHVPPERIIAISAGIDPIFRRLNLSPEDALHLRIRYGINRPFILYAGAADPHKNITALINAFGRLPLMLQNTHCLVIVGQLNETERSSLLASSSSLPSGTLVMTGYVPDADLVALYNLCIMHVFPSLHEGFGFPAAEAMACGAAVIASNRSSLPEILGRNDALFDPDTPETIAALITKVLTDRGFREDLQATGPAQAKRFTWEHAGQRTVDAFEFVHELRQQRKTTVSAFRLRLAVISPLPPERSGVAHYTAEHLPELAAHYDITCIVAQDTVVDDWILANFPVHNVAWFELHASSFDRVLYHFGNSPAHMHMFDLLERVPGVVMLHDFYLSSVLRWMAREGDDRNVFDRAVYESHGLSGLLAERNRLDQSGVELLPCSGKVIARADGVLVHSQHAIDLASSWYGEAAITKLWHVPFFRAPKAGTSRSSARKRLDISLDDFIVCSFGWTSLTKLNHRLLKAWVTSGLDRDPSCRLIFVGENDGGAYGAKLQEEIRRCGNGRVHVTGFVSTAIYLDHLVSADAGVQLRSSSRGETSAAIFDCLQQGLPLVINAHGSAAELPPETVIRLEDQFTDGELHEALLRLRRDKEAARVIGQRGLEYARRFFSPALAARRCRDAIEMIALAEGPSERHMLNQVETLDLEQQANATDAARFSACLNSNRKHLMPPRLFYDVTGLATNDLRTGIERVTSSLLATLAAMPPAGMRIEPVRATEHGYVHAHEHVRSTFGLRWSPSDTLVYAHPGDVILNTEWTPEILSAQYNWIVAAQARGLTYIQMVHDLLPVQRPDLFPNGISAIFAEWLTSLSEIADGLVCVSDTTEKSLRSWLGTRTSKRLRPLQIGVCKHGADLEACPLTLGLPEDADRIIGIMSARPAFLMVGTIEPRKGHKQALDAFEHLWAQDVDVSLVIVGKIGWNMGEVIRRLSEHPELGRRLIWLQGISDEMLVYVYRNAAALLAASVDEGYGLPIIEAALHNLPVLARDIPVFREIAGLNASYFQDDNRVALADAVRGWLEDDRRGEVPDPALIPIRTWRQSGAEIASLVAGVGWKRSWPD